jgi:hypothetical protein
VSTSVLRQAAAAALRIDDDAVPRHVAARQLVVQAAYEVGAPASADLAAELDCCPRTIRRLRTLRHPGLSAVLLCLSDDRLRHAAAPRR